MVYIFTKLKIIKQEIYKYYYKNEIKENISKTKES